MFLVPARPRRLRSLHPAERALVEESLRRCGVAEPEVCARAVRLARFVSHDGGLPPGPRSALARVALAGGADGITLGTEVFVPKRVYGRAGELPLDLVAHEVAHVAQYLRDGTLPFVARYLLAFARGRARGLTDRQAYLAIPYEVEARRVAAAVRGV
ncbi:MAG: DUF4157 domain-containing protein [Sandaracinaceae bacterium]